MWTPWIYFALQLLQTIDLDCPLTGTFVLLFNFLPHNALKVNGQPLFSGHQAISEGPSTKKWFLVHTAHSGELVCGLFLFHVRHHKM